MKYTSIELKGNKVDLRLITRQDKDLYYSVGFEHEDKESAYYSQPHTPRASWSSAVGTPLPVISGKGNISQTTHIVLKPVEENELDLVCEVYKQCEDFLSLGPVAKASKQMVLEDIRLSKDYGGIFCGIWVNEQMVGIVDYVPADFEGNPGHAHLSLLMIADGHRRTGLGRAVVELVENRILRDESITSILSGVQVNNPSAIAFWTTLGYKIVSGPELMPDTTTVYRLQKDTR